MIKGKTQRVNFAFQSTRKLFVLNRDPKGGSIENINYFKHGYLLIINAFFLYFINSLSLSFITHLFVIYLFLPIYSLSLIFGSLVLGFWVDLKKKTKGLVAMKSSPYVVGEDPKTRMRHQSLLLYFEQLQKVISLVDFHGFVISFVGFIRSDVLFDILKVCIFFDGFMVLFDLRFFFFFGVWLLPKMLSQNPLLQPTYFPQKKLIFSSLSQLIKHLVAKRISKRVAVR